MKMSAMDWIGWILLFVGGLNWGLVGLFDYNLVSGIFGSDSMIARIIYVLVGLAALWSLKMVMGKGNGGGGTMNTPM